MGSHRDKPSSAWRSFLSPFLLLLLISAPAAAQITTGTSSAGLYYEASNVRSGTALRLIREWAVVRQHALQTNWEQTHRCSPRATRARRGESRRR